MVPVEKRSVALKANADYIGTILIFSLFMNNVQMAGTIRMGEALIDASTLGI